MLITHDVIKDLAPKNDIDFVSMSHLPPHTHTPLCVLVMSYAIIQSCPNDDSNRENNTPGSIAVPAAAKLCLRLSGLLGMRVSVRPLTHKLMHMLQLLDLAC